MGASDLKIPYYLLKNPAFVSLMTGKVSHI